MPSEPSVVGLDPNELRLLEVASSSGAFSYAGADEPFEALLRKVFLARWGWSETALIIASVQSGSTDKEARQEELAKKRAECDRIDELLSALAACSYSDDLVKAITSAVTSLSKEPAVRDSALRFAYRHIRVAVGALHTVYLSACGGQHLSPSSSSPASRLAHLIFLGLGDVWSQIRKASASALEPILAASPLCFTRLLFATFIGNIHVVSENGVANSWQVQEGALLGVLAVLRAFRWTTWRPPSADLLSPHEEGHHDSRGGVSNHAKGPAGGAAVGRPLPCTPSVHRRRRSHSAPLSASSHAAAFCVCRIVQLGRQLRLSRLAGAAAEISRLDEKSADAKITATFPHRFEDTAALLQTTFNECIECKNRTALLHPFGHQAGVDNCATCSPNSLSQQSLQTPFSGSQRHGYGHCQSDKSRDDVLGESLTHFSPCSDSRVLRFACGAYFCHLPSWVVEPLFPVLFEQLGAVQPYVRGAAANVLCVLLSRCAVTVSVACFRLALHLLEQADFPCSAAVKRYLSTRSKDKDADGKAVPSPPLPNRKLLLRGAFEAQGYLGLLHALVVNLPRNFMIVHVRKLCDVVIPYLAHRATTVRTLASDVVSSTVFVRGDGSTVRDELGLAVLRTCVAGLLTGWESASSVDANLNDADTAAAKIEKLSTMMRLFAGQPDLVQEKSSAARNATDDDKALQPACPVGSWEWEEGRLLVFELILDHLTTRHAFSIFAENDVVSQHVKGAQERTRNDKPFSSPANAPGSSRFAFTSKRNGGVGTPHHPTPPSDAPLVYTPHPARKPMISLRDARSPMPDFNSASSWEALDLTPPPLSPADLYVIHRVLMSHCGTPTIADSTLRAGKTSSPKSFHDPSVAQAVDAPLAVPNFLPVPPTMPSPVHLPRNRSLSGVPGLAWQQFLGAVSESHLLSPSVTGIVTYVPDITRSRIDAAFSPPPRTPATKHVLFHDPSSPPRFQHLHSTSVDLATLVDPHTLIDVMPVAHETSSLLLQVVLLSDSTSADVTPTRRVALSPVALFDQTRSGFNADAVECSVEIVGQLNAILHHTLTCATESRWELRRMAMQVLPLVCEALLVCSCATLCAHIDLRFGIAPAEPTVPALAGPEVTHSPHSPQPSTGTFLSPRARTRISAPAGEAVTEFKETICHYEALLLLRHCLWKSVVADYCLFALNAEIEEAKRHVPIDDSFCAAVSEATPESHLRPSTATTGDNSSVSKIGSRRGFAMESLSREDLMVSPLIDSQVPKDTPVGLAVSRTPEASSENLSRPPLTRSNTNVQLSGVLPGTSSSMSRLVSPAGTMDKRNLLPRRASVALAGSPSAFRTSPAGISISVASFRKRFSVSGVRDDNKGMGSQRKMARRASTYCKRKALGPDADLPTAASALLRSVVQFRKNLPTWLPYVVSIARISPHARLRSLAVEICLIAVAYLNFKPALASALTSVLSVGLNSIVGTMSSPWFPTSVPPTLAHCLETITHEALAGELRQRLEPLRTLVSSSIQAGAIIPPSHDRAPRSSTTVTMLTSLEQFSSSCDAVAAFVASRSRLSAVSGASNTGSDACARDFFGDVARFLPDAALQSRPVELIGMARAVSAALFLRDEPHVTSLILEAIHRIVLFFAAYIGSTMHIAVVGASLQECEHGSRASPAVCSMQSVESMPAETNAEYAEMAGFSFGEPAPPHDAPEPITSSTSNLKEHKSDMNLSATTEKVSPIIEVTQSSAIKDCTNGDNEPSSNIRKGWFHLEQHLSKSRDAFSQGGTANAPTPVAFRPFSFWDAAYAAPTVSEAPDRSVSTSLLSAAHRKGGKRPGVLQALANEASAVELFLPYSPRAELLPSGAVSTHVPRSTAPAVPRRARSSSPLGTHSSTTELGQLFAPEVRSTVVDDVSHQSLPGGLAALHFSRVDPFCPNLFSFGDTDKSTSEHDCVCSDLPEPLVGVRTYYHHLTASACCLPMSVTPPPSACRCRRLPLPRKGDVTATMWDILRAISLSLVTPGAELTVLRRCLAIWRSVIVVLGDLRCLTFLLRVVALRYPRWKKQAAKVGANPALVSSPHESDDEVEEEGAPAHWDSSSEDWGSRWDSEEEEDDDMGVADGDGGGFTSAVAHVVVGLILPLFESQSEQYVWCPAAIVARLILGMNLPEASNQSGPVAAVSHWRKTLSTDEAGVLEWLEHVYINWSQGARRGSADHKADVSS